MKKKLFVVVALLSSLFIHAQTMDKKEALQFLKKNMDMAGLSAADLDNSVVSDAYFDKNAGVQLIYLQQAYKQIPVYNQLRTFAFKNGKLASSAGAFIASLDKKVNTLLGTALVSPQAAVLAAIADRKLKSSASPVILDVQNNGRRFEFDELDVSRQHITAELSWVPTAGNKVRLAWMVYIIPKHSADYWMVRIDATDTKVLGVDNYTVYCNWDAKAGTHASTTGKNSEAIPGFNFQQSSGATSNTVTASSPTIVNAASYRVIPFPAESPIHPGGAPSLQTNPWTLAPGNATSLKWNSNGTTNFTISRGNNVLAQEDRNNNNGIGLSAVSTTSPDPLTFDFAPSFTVAPTQTTPVQNQQFNITNLFYWNNIIHDLTYQYGFDEASGNFQDNNQGRGGLGNDYVMADAQDGGGTNNANFAAPPDGQNGRMQMYLWNGSPQKDGDVDNGVISHEFAHGISNRLTGGPSQAGCLSNGEQMGEGWSDYYALMYTQNWAIATLTTGFDSPRGLGTYVIGEGPNGAGIRNQKYCTNFLINNQVYATSISAEPHNRGELWCATLWDMTWNIINQVGSINPNIFDGNSTAGNTIALRLVTEGLKLQPCSPGFIDGRDAIINADQILYGGAHECAIREAFRRRGMGAFASQGSSSSVTDQVADFSLGGASFLLTQNGMTSVPEGGLITYTNTVTTNGCAPIANFLLTDTLPANVTYVSGGTYTASTRVVSFAVSIAAAQTQAYSFTVRVNAGAYFPTVTLFEDNVTTATIPSTVWTATSTTNTNWIVSNARSHSPVNSYYSFNQDVESDQRLFSTNNLALGATPPPLSFWHWYSTESTYDGGVVEISTNGGTTWTDLGPNIISGGYTGTMDGTTLLAGRRAFTGSSNNKFIKTKVNLTPFANQNVKFRFRFTSDVGTNLEGWYVDDIAVKNEAVVEMTSNFFTGGGVRIGQSDTITIITPPLSCNSVAVTTQPANTTACAGNNASITVVASGDAPSYQWQVSTDGGTTYTIIPGQTSGTLSLNNVTTGMNGNLYNVLISNTCPSNITSNASLLTVGDPASITAQPANNTICAGNAASFSVTAAGTSNTYQWQVSTDGGATFSDIPGATLATLNLPAVTPTLNNNQYHVIIGSCNPAPLTSANAVLLVNDPLAIIGQPAAVTVCPGSNAVFTINATGSGINYQWQVSTDGGATYSSIPGATASTYSIPAVTSALNNNIYNVIINGTCSSAVTSTGALLTVSSSASITSQPANAIACVGTTASFAATASGISYQWQVSTDGGATFSDIPGATTTILDLTLVTSTMNNNQYRLLVSSCTPTAVISNAAVLTVNEPAVITIPPTNQVTCAGQNAVFSVASTGTAVTYQWEVSTDGLSFSPIPGATSATLTINSVSLAMNGYKYRVILNNACTLNFTSNEVTLAVTGEPVITAGPSNISACNGAPAAFSVASSGTGLTFQWQLSTDGGATFTDIGGETASSLQLTAVDVSMNNNQYRVIVLNNCAATGITSTAATLTVLEVPVVVISAAPSLSVPDGGSTVLTATATPPSSTFSWFKDGLLITGITGNSITVTHDALGSYTATATSGTDCPNVSNALLIKDSIINISFIYPNPNNGFFYVNLSGLRSYSIPQTLTMYDSKGAKVLVNSKVVLSTDKRIVVHAEKLSKGVYELLIYDGSGITIAKGKVVIGL